MRTQLAGRSVIDSLCCAALGFAGNLDQSGALWAGLGSGEYVKWIYGTVSVLVLAIIIKEMPLGTQIIKAGCGNQQRAGGSIQSCGSDVACRIQAHPAAAIEADDDGRGNRRLHFCGARYSDGHFPRHQSDPQLSLLMFDYIADANKEKAAVLGGCWSSLSLRFF